MSCSPRCADHAAFRSLAESPCTRPETQNACPFCRPGLAFSGAVRTRLSNASAEQTYTVYIPFCSAHFLADFTTVVGQPPPIQPVNTLTLERRRGCQPASQVASRATQNRLAPAQKTRTGTSRGYFRPDEFVRYTTFYGIGLKIATERLRGRSPFLRNRNARTSPPPYVNKRIRSRLPLPPADTPSAASLSRRGGGGLAPLSWRWATSPVRKTVTKRPVIFRYYCRIFLNRTRDSLSSPDVGLR